MGPRAIAGDLVRDMAAGRDVHIRRGGEQKFDLIYVKDVARAIACALQAPDPAARIYNVGSGHLVTLVDVAAVARRVMPESPSAVHIGPGLDPMQLGWANYGLLDTTQARTELGFVPRYDLQAGITDYVTSL